MAQLIADSMVRYSLVATYLGEEVVNIFDMYVDIDDGPLGPTRRAGCDRVGADLLNAWVEHILPALHSAYVFERVDYIDLGSAGGPTGTVTSTEDNVLPLAGGNSSGDPLPASVAMRVDKVSDTERGQRNGRMFLVGLNETMIEGNNFTSGIIQNFQTAFDAFLPAITETGVVDDYNYDPRVIHVVGGVFQNSTSIETYVPRRASSTQVRRLPGR